jgi:hypothetical protein
LNASVDIVGIEGRARDRLEQPPLFVLVDELGDLAGDLVHAPVGEVVTPSSGLHIEVQ